ncbi:MAG: rRNA maturation RNase YbeY [Coriobacteriales bacterium]|nr:rRNA maturation RNase YbeY [Coriobacteriales bacterium]
MLANVAYEEDVPCALQEEEICAICELVLREEGVQRACYVSVSTVDEARMQELNNEWRQQDRATDVISLECERPDDPELAKDEPCELGDIVLAPTYIARQAASFGTTPADETRLLLIHGMLHLLGYDHMSDDEAAVMEAREDELLAMHATDADMTGVVLTRHEGELLS